MDYKQLTIIKNYVQTRKKSNRMTLLFYVLLALTVLWTFIFFGQKDLEGLLDIYTLSLPVIWIFFVPLIMAIIRHYEYTKAEKVLQSLSKSEIERIEDVSKDSVSTESLAKKYFSLSVPPVLFYNSFAPCLCVCKIDNIKNVKILASTQKGFKNNDSGKKADGQAPAPIENVKIENMIVFTNDGKKHKISTLDAKALAQQLCSANSNISCEIEERAEKKKHPEKKKVSEKK